MKIKKVLAVCLASFTLVGAVAVGVSASRKDIKPAHATVTTGYSVIGALGNYTVNKAAENWNYDHYLTNVGSNTYKTTINFKSGDSFKIRVDGAWTTTYGGDKLGTVASGFTNLGGNDKNIGVSVTGWYDISLNTSSQRIDISAHTGSTTKRVYFDIDNSGVSWKSESDKSFKLYCHYYGCSSGSAWPGQSMMSNTITQFSRSIYYYDVPIDTQSIIFVRSPDDDTSNAWNRWNVTNPYTNYRVGLGYNYFQPSWWNDGGTHKFNAWDDDTIGEYGSGDAGGNPYTGYKAYNSTYHVNSSENNELAVNWDTYAPASPSISGQEFVGWCTNSGLTADYTPATPTADVELWAKFAVSTRIVMFGGAEGDVCALSATEWSVTSTFAAGAKFKFVKTFNNDATQDFWTLQSGLSSIATYADGYITMINAGTYSMYLKLPSDNDNPNKIYIMAATAESEAYSFADFFLANIGCDSQGVKAPTGWTTCATRYSTLLSDAAKNYLYNFDMSASHDVGDKIVTMIETYEWAINHNPNTLAHFIKNSSGKERPVAGARVAFMNTAIGEANSNVVIIIAVISGLLLISAGGYLLFKRRRIEE